MRDRDFTDYLQDILDSINEIREFTEGMTFNDFAADKKTVNAVFEKYRGDGGGFAKNTRKYQITVCTGSMEENDSHER